MARVPFWSRYFVENLSYNGSTGNFFQVVATLTPGQTLLRSIVSMDIGLSMTVAPDTDLGIVNPVGLHLDTSNTSPSISPYSNPSNLTPGWIWWQQLTFRFDYFSAGTPNIWSYRNDETCKIIDTRTQRQNTTAANQYLWFQFQASSYINWVTDGMQAFGSIATEFLILDAP